ncbi:hypothetical protein NBRC116602_13370 [Hyphomicrobiales bacterium 4NK60-0047b]|jgi:hypothetical protein
MPMLEGDATFNERRMFVVLSFSLWVFALLQMPTMHPHYLPTKGGILFDQLIRTRFTPLGLIWCA